MSNYIFLGPPGAGKGTMAEMLCDEFTHIHISTGDMLRAEMKGNSELGKLARQYVESGTLVPDDLVAAIVERRLAEDEVRERGFVLDGYPRTLPQADLLADVVERVGLPVAAVVLFEVGEDLLLKRLTSRRVCGSCGAVFNVLFHRPKVEDVCDKCSGELLQRKDDTITTALDRLGVYRTETEPLVDYYEQRQLLARVDASVTRDENFRNLRAALDI